MPVSNYVIRRYTPPTCTLEVLAQNSALSRWMGKSVLKQLSFELRFDDPRLPEEQRLAIRGTQDQLEALYTTVTNYVQELLQKSPENFWVSSSKLTESSKVPDAFPTSDFNDSSVETNNPNSFSTQIPGTELQIQPSHHLTHDLFLSSLANQVSGPVIQLSLLQLFDLATALDEYSADVLALPNINSNRSATAVATWIPVAAVIALAVGLTPVTLQYAHSIKQKQQTAKKSSPTPEKIASAPPPSLQLLTPPPSLLLSPDSLPSPPKPPLGSMPLVGSAVPLNPQASPNSTFPTTFGTSIKSNFPLTSQTSPNTTFSQGSRPSFGSTLTVPGTTTAQTFPYSKKGTPPTLGKPQIISLQPNLSHNGTGSTFKKSPQIALQPNGQNRTGLTPNGEIPLSQSGIPSGNFSTASNAYPDANVNPNLATIPNNSSNRINPLNVQPDPLATSENASLIAKLKGTRPNTSTEVATNNRTLFDTAQVAEARDYLKKHWQPPAELKQPIQYSLLVGVDGTIEQILPLGKAARDFIDRSGMPLIGENFVSPNKNGQTSRIRAVLSPDGKVQTFPENK